MIDMFNDLLIVIIPALIGSGSALLTKKLDKKYYPTNEILLERSRTLMLFGQVYFDSNKIEHINLPPKIKGEYLNNDDISIRIEIECDSLIMHIRNKEVRNAIISFRKSKTKDNYNVLLELFGKYYGI